MRVYLNDNWTYFDGQNGEIKYVRLPHSNVQTPFNCFDESVYQFESRYENSFPAQKGKTYLLTFEGVAHRAEVYVNGSFAGSHDCGYTAFTLDVTPLVVNGENKLVVKVDSRETLNQPPFGFVIDYLTYGGIYREAYLDEYEGCYASDVFVTATHNRFNARVTLADFAPCTVRWQVSLGGEAVAEGSVLAQSASVDISHDVNFKLWDVNDPVVYDLAVCVGNNVYETTFGVRTARFTDKGFFLNGKKVKIVGLNRHQSYPYVGYAMPESMQRLDAQILKNKLCVNAVRTSHYPQSKYFLDECDRLGLLVFTEIPGWQHIGDDEWRKKAVQNVKDMVLQYRNHPSVVLWGVRINESQDCDELYTQTNEVAHSLDPTRQTGGVRYLQRSRLLEDVYTYNDFNRNGATDKKFVCDKKAPYLISEYNGHMFPTKSYDDFPHRRQHMLRYAKMLDDVFAADTCGAFGWCFADYNTHKDFGSGDRICYHGVTDMFRNPKMAAGVFSAMGKQPFLQLCFTSDIGDYPEGVVGDMYCLTNAEYVEVYKGGVFIKRYTHRDSPFRHLPCPPILIDDLIGNRLTEEEGISPKYAKIIKQVLADIRRYGANFLPLKSKLKILRIMAGTKMSLAQLTNLYGKYESNWGSEAGAVTVKAFVGEQVVQQTTGAAHRWTLEASPSKTVLQETSTYDVAAVSVALKDEYGNVCPYACRAVTFRTEGVIELVGQSTLPLYGGVGGTYVKTTGKKGEGTLYVDDTAIKFTVR